MSQNGINATFRNNITALSKSLVSTINTVSTSLNDKIDNKTTFSNLSLLPASESKITFNSLVNTNSDKAFLLYKDDSTYHINGSNENSRLSIGLYNDNETVSGEGLDLQGAGSLIFNVGTWDSELNTSIGAQYGLPSGNPIKFRINNVDKAYFDSNGGITSSVGLKVGTNGLVFGDNTVLTTATMAAGVSAAQVTGAISNLATRAEVTGAIAAVGGVNSTQVSGAITGALSNYSTTSQISSSFLTITNASSSFGLKSDLTASYATKVQVTGAISNLASRAEVSGAITGSGIVSLNGNNTYTGLNNYNNITSVNSTFQADYFSTAYTLWVDSYSHRVGIRNSLASPQHTFDVIGDGRYTDNLYLSRSLYTGPISNNLDNSPTTFGGISTMAAITADKFYLAPPGNDFTASFTNIPTNDYRTTTVSVYLSQSSAAKQITAVRVNNTSSNINWLNNSIPTVNANKIDVYTFNILRIASAWLVTGEFKTYG